MSRCSILKLCQLSDISPQAYYAGRKKRQRKAIDEDRIIALVNQQRSQHPRMGTRKLLHLIEPALKETGIEIGRDRLFEVLRLRNMLVKPKRRWVQTTDSRHNLPLYRNLIGELQPTAPHQVLVSDITYLRTDEGWLYLSLVMDLYSRKIVGWNLADNLKASESAQALKMAVKQVSHNRWPIHHSDRGSQYCCYEYTQILRDHHWSISMTEENHCAENCYAERINGILKNEYNLDLDFCNKEQALKATAQAINLYNYHRPHQSLGMSNPAQIHRMAA